MSRHFAQIALIANLSLFASSVVANEPSIELPVEGSQSTIEMWYVHDAQPSHPEVIILADGRMQIMSPEGPQRSQLPAKQVKNLLRALLFQDGLNKVDSSTLLQRVNKATEQTGLSSCIEGAGDTVIRIRTANSYREIRCPAVGILAVRFPEVQGVTAMAAAQRRLENVRAVATVGGGDEAKFIANLAQEAVANQYGVSIPVSKEDLSMVRALPDGSRFCQFVVAHNGGQDSSLQMISITETPGHRPVVQVIGEPVVR